MKLNPSLRRILSLIAVLSSGAHAQTITSAVPGYISYQGRALNSAGVVVGSGTPVNRTVTFRVWDHSSNTLAPSLLYSEQQVVTISEGEFSVLIGQGTATAATTLGFSESSQGPPTVKISDSGVFAGANRYLGVTIDDGTAAVDNEISPRQQIVASAYALRAKYAEQLGSNGGAALTALDSGNVGIGNANPPARFTITAASTSTATPQMLLTADDTSERLRLGVNSTGNGSGFLQSYKEGSGAQNLLLNPDGGFVGIGNANPTVALDVTGAIKASGAITGGSIAATGAVTASTVTATGAITGGSINSAGTITGGSLESNLGAKLRGDYGYSFRTVGDTDGGLFSTSDGNVSIRTNGSDRLKINESGIVSIGTTSNSAKLNVGSDPASYRSYAHLGINGANANQSILDRQNAALSINAEGYVLAVCFDVSSDVRIKTDRQPTDSSADLKTLQALQITDYRFIDKVANGDTPQKKVIAQQVETVFPQAVQSRTGVVPDIFKSSTVKDGWVALTTDLKVGERVRLISGENQAVEEVLEVRAGAFRTQFQTGTSEVFVYGREVPDFHSVDYDAIAMLNVSATQELARGMEALQGENAALRRELAAKEQAMELRLIALEQRLTQDAVPKTVSIETANAAN